MRINHKSDFDFRLDLYAADPYGSAVAAGFPECDFTGKLFIGPSSRAKQSYAFSKRGKKLTNCFDSGGHISVVAASHNLSAGPLYCELALKVPDDKYPAGYRSAVFTFPLNIFLCDTDAEQVTPVVAVNLPVLQKTAASGGATQDAADEQEEIAASNAASNFDAPWLAPKVCGGHFRTGAFPGNFYRNDRGAIYLSGFKRIEDGNYAALYVHIPTLLKLGIEGLTADNLLQNIRYSSCECEVSMEIHQNVLKLTCENAYYPGYYLKIKESPYATITPEGKIKHCDSCHRPEYKPKPVSMNEVLLHAEKTSANVFTKIFLQFGSTYILQKWAVQKRVRAHREDLYPFTVWVKPKYRIFRWQHKKIVHERVAVRPLFFRIARKKNGTISDWLYFKATYRADGGINLFQTDENGAKITGNAFLL